MCLFPYEAISSKILCFTGLSEYGTQKILRKIKLLSRPRTNKVRKSCAYWTTTKTTTKSSVKSVARVIFRVSHLKVPRNTLPFFFHRFLLTRATDFVEKEGLLAVYGLTVPAICLCSKEYR